MSPQEKSDGIEFSKAKNSLKNGTLYTQMERGGLNYIKNQRNYLILSAIVPLVCFLIQIINLYITFIFFINRVPPETGPSRWPGNPFLIIDISTPIVILLFSLLALVHFIYLFSWRRKVSLYEQHKKKSIDIEHEDEISDIHVTLTQLFYDIIDNMETIKKIFIALNVVVIFYLQWFFRFFLFELMRIVSPRMELNLFRNIMPWLNLFLQFLLIFYLIMNWKHFKHWNRKLNKLKDFEKRIYTELDMEDKLLLIHGNDQDLEEIKVILTQQEKNLSIKYISISDKEEFEKRFNDLIND